MAIEIALEPRRFMRIGTLQRYTAWYQKYTFPRSTSCVLEFSEQEQYMRLGNEKRFAE